MTLHNTRLHRLVRDDLLVLTSLNQLLLTLQRRLAFVQTSDLNEEVNRIGPSFKLVFPGQADRLTGSQVDSLVRGCA